MVYEPIINTSVVLGRPLYAPYGTLNHSMLFNLEIYNINTNFMLTSDLCRGFKIVCYIGNQSKW